MRGQILLLLLLTLHSTTSVGQQGHQMSSAIGGIETEFGHWIIVKTEVSTDQEVQYQLYLIAIDMEGAVQSKFPIINSVNRPSVNGIHLYENGDLLILVQLTQYSPIFQQYDVLIWVTSSGEVLGTVHGVDYSSSYREILLSITPNQPEIATISSGQVNIYTLTDLLQAEIKTSLPIGGRQVSVNDVILVRSVLATEHHYNVLTYNAPGVPSFGSVEKYLITDPSSVEVVDFELDGTPTSFIAAKDEFIVFGEYLIKDGTFLIRVGEGYNQTSLTYGTALAYTIAVVEADESLIILGKSSLEDDYVFIPVRKNVDFLPAHEVHSQTGQTQEFFGLLPAHGGALAYGRLDDEVRLIKVNDDAELVWDTSFPVASYQTTSERTRIPFLFPILLIPIVAKLKKLITQS